MLSKRNLVWALVTLPLLAPSALAQERDPADAEVARLFEKSCASCHVVPDAKLATDKAWLEQLAKTA